MENMTVILPYFEKNISRRNNLIFSLHYWKTHFPTLNIIVVEYGTYPFAESISIGNKVKYILVADPNFNGNFNKNYCYNKAYSICKDYKIVFTQIDVFIDPLDLVLALKSNKSIVKPYTNIVYLNDEDSISFTQYKYCYNEIKKLGVVKPDLTLAGGCIILTKDVVDSVGCWDTGFRGWGMEDVAMSKKIEYLIGLNDVERFDNTAIHIWHEDADKTDEERGNLNPDLKDNLEEYNRIWNMLKMYKEG